MYYLLYKYKNIKMNKLLKSVFKIGYLLERHVKTAIKSKETPLNAGDG